MSMPDIPEPDYASADLGTLTEGLAMWSSLPEGKSSALIAAIMAAIEDVLGGDCAGCSCSTCVSFRGVWAGLTDES